MTASHPPHVADWLLRRLASGPKTPSIIGDLHEQYGRGRSSAWYWRQTLGAIAASVIWDVRRHPVFALRTLVLTYVFLLPWVYVTGNLYAFSKWWMMDHILRDRRLLHDLWVIYSVPLLAAWCCGWALAGWLLAKVQPQSRAGVTFVALCAQLPLTISYTMPLWRLANLGLPFFVTFPPVANASVVVFGLPASLLIGSLLAEAEKVPAARPPT